MGQARNTKDLTQFGRKLNLGAAQHERSQQSTSFPPRELLKPDCNPPAEIGDRGPASSQKLKVRGGEPTPAAPRRKSFSSSIEKRMRTG